MAKTSKRRTKRPQPNGNGKGKESERVFDLDAAPHIPDYVVKIKGEMYRYEAFKLGFQLRNISPDSEPDDLIKIGKEVFGLDLTSLETVCILIDYQKFMTEYEDPLKKLYDSLQFSTTPTESVSESTELSP